MQQFFRQAILRFVKCHNVVRLQPIPQVGHGRTVQAQVAAGPVFRHGEAALVLPDGIIRLRNLAGLQLFCGARPGQHPRPPAYIPDQTAFSFTSLWLYCSIESPKAVAEKPLIRANVQTVCRKCAAAFLHKERTPNLTI